MGGGRALASHQVGVANLIRCRCAEDEEEKKQRLPKLREDGVGVAWRGVG